MDTSVKAVLAGQVEAAAKAAGLVVASSAVGADFSGNPTTRFTLGLADEPAKVQGLTSSEPLSISAPSAKTQVLELSDKFDFSRADLLAEVQTYLTEAAKR